MSTTTRWNRQEREIAARLNKTRLPNNGTTQADCRIDGVAYQVKTRTALPSWLTNAMSQPERDCHEGERPAVILSHISQGRKARRLVVLPFEHLTALTGRGSPDHPSPPPSEEPRAPAITSPLAKRRDE